jgi:heme/copper-type cytochrome/quinol oxidase subunit 2
MKNIGRKGQGFSWTWATTAATAGLLFAAFIFIIFDQVKTNVGVVATELDADAEHMSLLNAVWTFAPILVVLSWGVFVIIVSAATRGGGYI